MKRVDEQSTIRGPVGNCEPKRKRPPKPASAPSIHATKVVMHPRSSKDAVTAGITSNAEISVRQPIEGKISRKRR